MTTLPAWLAEVIDAASSGCSADAQSSAFLSVAFLVPGRAQGAVHLPVAADEATVEQAERFAHAVQQAGADRKLAVRVIWRAVTHGPHSGAQHGVMVAAVESLEAPELEQLHISQTIAAAMKLSESSVLAIGDEMRSIRELANSQADGLKRVASQFTDSSATAERSSTMGDTIERLTGQMREFGQQIVKRTQRQAADIEQARAWTADIMKLGRAIAHIAGDARILTFNARLESARLGESGRGFAVIAGSIQELAAQVRTTNESVAALAENLAATLPRLGSDATETSSHTREAVSQLEQQLLDVQTQLAAARSESWEALSDSSDRARDLESRANSVIHHLQFQDRTSQMLQEVGAKVSAVISIAGLQEEPVEQHVIDQVGVLGKQFEGDASAAPGSVELF